MVRQRWPATIVVLVHGNLAKPIDGDDIALRIERLAVQVSIQRQLCKARLDLARLKASEQIVGRSDVMCRMMDRLNAIAARDVSVLLLGETGTGKDLAARTINDRGPRRGKPFVAVNCAAFPDRLLETELFGDERSALAGAGARRSGRFAAANGGTLLLEEVGDMSTALQGKLLRVLETRAIEPRGTNVSIGVDVRVISTTNRDPAQMVAAGLFRADLYRRLSFLSLDLPPLREREGDLPLLAQYFLNRFHRRGNAPTRLSPAAWSALTAFGFPGNVRQLGQAIAHAIIMASDAEIEPRHLPGEITAGPGAITVARPSQTPHVAKAEVETHQAGRTIVIRNERQASSS
jgi:DNA-binding NtrC family response regulator